MTLLGDLLALHLGSPSTTTWRYLCSSTHNLLLSFFVSCYCGKRDHSKRASIGSQVCFITHSRQHIFLSSKLGLFYFLNSFVIESSMSWLKLTVSGPGIHKVILLKDCWKLELSWMNIYCTNYIMDRYGVQEMYCYSFMIIFESEKSGWSLFQSTCSSSFLSQYKRESLSLHTLISVKKKHNLKGYTHIN